MADWGVSDHICRMRCGRLSCQPRPAVCDCQCPQRHRVLRRSHFGGKCYVGFDRDHQRDLGSRTSWKRPTRRHFQRHETSRGGE
ncbi:unnamed protein product, partial [Ectocarpus sp. 12 AP-2014]